MTRGLGQTRGFSQMCPPPGRFLSVAGEEVM